MRWAVGTLLWALNFNMLFACARRAVFSAAHFRRVLQPSMLIHGPFTNRATTTTRRLTPFSSSSSYFGDDVTTPPFVVESDGPKQKTTKTKAKAKAPALAKSGTAKDKEKEKKPKAKRVASVPLTPVAEMTLEQARVELVALDTEIDRHDALYYELGVPEISDAAYDKLVRRAEDLEGKFGVLKGTVRHLQRVGRGRSLSKFAAFKHARPLLSLDNALSLEEVGAFLTKCETKLGQSEGDGEENPPLEYLVEPKIDGLSLAIHYKGGELVGAGTRGDGSEGDDVTANARLVQDVPSLLSQKLGSEAQHVEVRGEVYISTEDFASLNAERTRQNLTLFSTPRNAAAGSLRQVNVETARDRSRSLRFFAYSLFIDGEPLSSQADCLAWLSTLGFKVAQPWRLCHNRQEVLEHCNAINAARVSLGYDIDGAVVKLSSTAQQQVMGALPRFPRWAVAYKFPAEEAETKLLDIQVQVGRTGVLTPVAHLQAVLLGGVCIERATLHNEGEVRRLRLRPGLTVRVKRAGDVIPKVVGLGVGQGLGGVAAASTEKEEGEESDFSLPSACPVCGSPTEREEGGALVRCTGGVACSAQAVEQIRHFCSRDAADIEGLGAATAEELYADGLLKSPADIYSLRRLDLEGSGADSPLGQLRNKKGWGDRSVNNLLAAIDAKRELPLARFLLALGVRHVGQETARLLAGKFTSFEALWNYLKAESLRCASDDSAVDGDANGGAVAGQTLLDMDGIGPKATAALLRLAKDSRSAQVIESLLQEVRVLDHEGVAGAGDAKKTAFDPNSLAGQTVVFTGRFKLIARKDAEAFCEQQGASIGKQVSGTTTLLVEAGGEGGGGGGEGNGDAPATAKLSSKARKARTLGVTVLSEDAFVKMFSVV